ncbi:MAG: isoleucine--tRNA ligase [Puniceicoccales bacterium]|jgi:isoleucyl-tRNA synthetase|nr:isoleucine--tRNA ligase [Puniceicoccales bacterium]
MDLKDTLNLPKTGFPMRADLVNREPERIEKWRSGGIYEKIQKKNAGGPSFILHDGPPFTNGYVHIGTALNKILKDIIVRYKSMRGFRTPYVPGWDCHGLPIEHKVAMELRDREEEFDAISLRRACAEYAKKFICVQRAQFERLGILADWENDYRTMDPAYEECVLNFFADCVAQGLIYRSKKPVYWSIPCKTALAEAEVEYKEHTSPSIWVKFKFTEGENEKFHTNAPTYAVIWTTTPWTIPSNVAIAVHPTLNYTLLDCGTENYLICEDRAQDFLQACKIESRKVIATFNGAALEGLCTQHPIVDRVSKIVLANYVTTDSGTGCVHIAPGHGLEDYATGMEYGLDVYCPLDDGGRYVNDGMIPAELVGISVLDADGECAANDKIIEMLSKAGALLARKQYEHQYPHCWRSKTPIIFRAMAQWFIALDENGLREKMLEAAEKVNWIPAWGKNRIRAAIASRTDWCISRQRAWGIPLPVFYNGNGDALLDEVVVREVAKKIGQRGSDFWFDATEEDILDGIKLPSGWNVGPLKKCTDSLDVWIDSGNSHRAVLQNNEKLSWPADMYLEGSDQHRGWFQSSMWTSIISGNGKAPFKNVLTHGFIVGDDKKKISKSDGKPQTADDYVNKFGADVLRLWISSEDFRSDITISDDIIGHVSSTYRTIRNTLRFQIGNLFDFSSERNSVVPDEMTLVDKWILEKTRSLVKNVTAAYDAYELHKVYQLINRFCSVELSATCHDILKDRLYTFAPNSHERRSSQTAIYIILNTVLALLAPIATFTCDEAMAYATNDSDFCDLNIQLIDWPDVDSMVDFSNEECEFDELLKFKTKVNEQLERARQSKSIGQSLDAKAIIEIARDHPAAPLLKKHAALLPEIFIVSQVQIADNASAGACSVTVVSADGERCPRSWKWVDHLVDAGEFGRVSQKCFDALIEKYPEIVKKSQGCNGR